MMFKLTILLFFCNDIWLLESDFILRSQTGSMNATAMSNVYETKHKPGLQDLKHDNIH